MNPIVILVSFFIGFAIGYVVRWIVSGSKKLREQELEVRLIGKDDEISKVQGEIKMQTATLNTLRDALALANEKTRTLEEKSSEQETSIAELGKEAEQKTTVIAYMESEISNLNAKLLATETVLQNKTEAYAALEAETKSSLDDFANTEKQLKELQTKFASLQSENKILNQALDNKDVEIAELQESVRKFNELKVALSALEEDLDKSKNEADLLRDELNSLKTGNTENESALHDLEEKMQTAVSNRDAEISRFHEIITGQDAAIANLQRSISGKDEEIARLQSQLKEFESAQIKFNESQSTISQQENEISTLNAEIERLSSENEKFNTYQAQIFDYDAKMSQMASQHQAALSDKQAEIERLNARLGVADSLNAQTSTPDEKSENLQALSNEENHAVEAPQSESGNSDAEISEPINEEETPNFDNAVGETENQQIAEVNNQSEEISASEDEPKPDAAEETSKETETDLSIEPTQEGQIELTQEAQTELSGEQLFDKADKPVKQRRQYIPGALYSPPTVVDDLKIIPGVNNVLAELLNEFGIYTFRQIATWTESDIEFIYTNVEQFKGRISNKWVARAKEEHFKKYGERV